MRSRFAFVLALAALPAPTHAQRLTPSGIARPAISTSVPKPPTRFIQRMHRYGNWGAVAGAMTGFGVGMLTTPATEERTGQLLTNMLLGASIGNLGGLIVGLNERQPSDTLPAILSPDVMRSPLPLVAARIDDMSNYVGMGGRIGASIGMLGGALMARRDNERGLLMVLGGLEGWVGGMLVGGVTYAIRRAQD